MVRFIEIIWVAACVDQSVAKASCAADENSLLQMHNLGSEFDSAEPRHCDDSCWNRRNRNCFEQDPGGRRFRNCVRHLQGCCDPMTEEYIPGRESFCANRICDSNAHAECCGVQIAVHNPVQAAVREAICANYVCLDDPIDLPMKPEPNDAECCGVRIAVHDPVQDALRQEICADYVCLDDQPDDPPIRACCEALTAQCESCKAGMTVDEYCRSASGSGMIGCPTSPAPDGPIIGRPVPDGPIIGRPVPDGPITGRPVLDGPITGRPVPDGPITGWPVPDGPITGRPVPEPPMRPEPTRRRRRG